MFKLLLIQHMFTDDGMKSKQLLEQVNLYKGEGDLPLEGQLNKWCLLVQWKQFIYLFIEQPNPRSWLTTANEVPSV